MQTEEAQLLAQLRQLRSENDSLRNQLLSQQETYERDLGSIRQRTSDIGANTNNRDLERQLLTQKREGERLADLLRMKIEELEEYKNKYADLELNFADIRGRTLRGSESERTLETKLRELAKELDNLKTRNDQIERALQDERRAREEERLDYETSMRRAVQNSQALGGNSDRLEQEKRAYAGERDELQRRLTFLETEVVRGQEAQSRVVLLAAEIERLNMLKNSFVSRDSETSTIREENAKLRIIVEDALRERDEALRGHAMHSQSREDFDRDIRRIREALEAKSAELEATKGRLRSLEGTKREYEESIAQLSTELERVTMLLREKGEE
jgi:chromosome segregation ATPase